MSRTYIPALDGLRALSVLGVLFFHSGIGYPGGFLGVDVFFVLSGYLITSILLEDINSNGRIRFGDFYLRRARRLLPALFATLALAGVLASIRGREVFGTPAIAALFYYANWMVCLQSPHSMGDLIHTWSLSVEEQFYIVWPALLLILVRRYGAGDNLAKLILRLVVALAVARGALYCLHSCLASYYSTLARADALLIGCACALWMCQGRGAEFWRGRRGTLVAWTCAFTLLVLSFFVTPESDFLFIGGFTLVALYAAAVILHLIASPSRSMARFFANKIFVAIGKRSYGIYLYHLPVFLAFPAPPPSYGAWAILGIAALKIVLTCGIAWLSYRYVELPFLRRSSFHGHDGGASQGRNDSAEQQQDLAKAA